MSALYLTQRKFLRLALGPNGHLCTETGARRAGWLKTARSLETRGLLTLSASADGWRAKAPPSDLETQEPTS